MVNCEHQKLLMKCYLSPVPLLSRLLPSDVCKIYKTGTCIRLDSTLGDFTEMRWSRGDLSFIFNGEDNRNNSTLSMIVLDNQTKVYQKMKLLGSVSVLSLPLPPPLSLSHSVTSSLPLLTVGGCPCRPSRSRQPVDDKANHLRQHVHPSNHHHQGSEWLDIQD